MSGHYDEKSIYEKCGEAVTQSRMVQKKKHGRQNGGLKLKHYICHNNHKTYLNLQS